MDEIIYDLIESPDPKDRKRAIKLLAQDGSQDAIKVLAQLYKQETDPDIKELAVKAGQYIKKQQLAGNWEGGGRQLTPDPDPKAAPKVEVSPAREKEAKSLMDQALDYLMNDNRVKAVATARKAFMMNPNLQHDDYYMGVANEVTGRDKEETIAMLTTPEPKSGKEKPKRKNSEGATDDATWGEALTDLAIYGLVNAAIVIVGMLLLIQLVAPPLREAIATLPPPPPSEFGSFEEMQAQNQQEMLMALSGFLAGAGIVLSIIYGVIYGIFAIVALLIQLFFIHIAATMVLSGEGTFPRLIRKITNFVTVVSVISSVLGFIFIYVTFNSMLSTTLTATSDAAAMDMMSNITGISGILGLISFIGGIVVFSMYCNRIGEAYDFGAGKGCLSLIISSIMLSALSCVVQLACSSILQQAIVNAMMSSPSGF